MLPMVLIFSIGLGFLILIFFCYFKNRIKIGFKDTKGPIYKLLNQTFSFEADFSIFPSLKNGKFLFVIYNIEIYKRIDDTLESSLFSKVFLSIFSPLFFFLKPIFLTVVRSFQHLISFKVSQLKIILIPCIKNKQYTEASLIDYLELCISDVFLNCQDDLLKFKLILKHICTNSNSQTDIFLGVSLNKDLKLFINENRLEVNLTPELLVCVGSLIIIDPNKQLVIQFKKIFCLLEGVHLNPVDISINLPLRTFPPDFRYFESLSISLIKFGFRINIDLFESSCLFGEFVTFAADSPGNKVCSKAFRMVEPKTKKHRLIYASNLEACIRYMNFEEFGSTFATVKAFIQTVGSPAFNYESYLSNGKCEPNDFTKPSIGIGFDIKAEQVEFGCSFEYPLTLVFDELINVIKGSFGIQPKSLNGDLLINYSFTLNVHVDNFLLYLADGFFDRNLEALLLKDSSKLKTSYTCFKVTCRELEFIVKWDQRLLQDNNFQGFSELVNRIENEKYITSAHCQNFATCLGGWTELHAKNLLVNIKDEEDFPLVNAPILSVVGLLFLLELAPYEDALLEVPLILNLYPDNLKRIINDGFTVSKSINPIKLFHAFVGEIFGEEPAIITYNLYWPEIFESVSRGFEIFSSPPNDPSPVMSVFDKMPYIFRGCNSCLVTSTFTEVIIGLDTNNRERLVAQIPGGILISQKESPAWYVKLGDTSVYLESQLLGYLVDEMVNLEIIEKDRIVKVGTLPAFQATVDFETNQKCSHWQVRPISFYNSPPADTYAQYRTKSIKMKIDFMFEGSDNPVQISYNRHMEDWIATHILRLTGSKVKTGPLWSSWLIPQLSNEQGFAVCLKEIELHFSISLPLEIKFYSFGRDIEEKLWPTMAALEASHGNFLFVLGRKSYHRGFSLVYSDSDYNQISISVDVGKNAPPKLLLSSDRLANVVVDEGYFKIINNFLIMNEHRARLLKKQAKMKNLPFINKRIEEIEQQINRIQSVEEGELIVRRQFTIFKAYILWDKLLRNCIFKLVDAQISYEMGNQARTVSLMEIEKIIQTIEQKRVPDGELGEESQIVSPRDLAQKMVHDLLMEQKQPFIAQTENPKLLNIKADDYNEDDLKVLFGLDIFSKTTVDILDVQVCLETVATFGSRYGEQEAAILSVPRISLYSSLLHNEEGKPLFRRSKLEISDAKVSVAYYKFFGEEHWPPFISPETEQFFIPVTNRINIKVTYDSSFNTLQKIKLQKGDLKFKLQGSFIQVECPAFEVECSNEEYYVIYELIVNLLVYRDPNMAKRSQRTSEFVKTNEFTEGQDLLDRISALKMELFEATNELSVEYRTKKELLSALLEIVHSWKSLKARQQNKQSRLELKVILRKLSWKLALHGAFIAEANLIEILNQWLSLEDGSMSNLLEVQNITGVNTMPDAFYKTMIVPLNIELLERLGIDFGGGPLSTANYGSLLRIFFRASFPDLGKVVIEHAEIDLSPLFAQVTQEIVEALFEYFFPHSQTSTEVENSENTKDKENEDVMAVDAQKYFSYVVVPQSRHLLSFKVKSPNNY
jgi:hypothetical protein